MYHVVVGGKKKKAVVRKKKAVSRGGSGALSAAEKRNVLKDVNYVFNAVRHILGSVAPNVMN
jgi:hypothetical protein